MNLLAFALGRLSIQDRAALDVLLQVEAPPIPLADRSFDEIVARAREVLTQYQNAAYADRFESFVSQISRQDPNGAFSKSVALNLFKLMRYKDEYEVARLYAAPQFRQALGRAFEGSVKLEFNLAPPIIAFRRNSAGEPRKMKFGRWMMPAFRVLQHFKILRGTPLDPFGYSADRKLERRLLDDYQSCMQDIAGKLEASDYKVAVELAELPNIIRGYGPVKERGAEEALLRREELMTKLVPAAQVVHSSDNANTIERHGATEPQSTVA